MGENVSMLTGTVSSTLTRNVRMLHGMTKTVETLGERLRRAREEAELTQDALGKAIGVTRSAISQAELGITNSLNAENLIRAARRLGKNAIWLATGEGEEHSADGLGDVISALPDHGPTLDYILFQINQAKGFFGDRAADYSRMVEKIKADLEKRKKKH